MPDEYIDVSDQLDCASGIGDDTAPHPTQIEPVPGNGHADELVVPGPEPRRLAEHYIAHRARSRPGDLLLRRWRGEFWRWEGGVYVPHSEEALDAELYELLDGAGYITKVDGAEQFCEIRLRSNLVREVRLALPSLGLLVDGEEPCWLSGGSHRPDPAELVACSNGLLHLPTRKLLPPTPHYLTTSACPVPWLEQGCEPTNWLRFLDSLWDDDDQSIRLLQEWFGYSLAADTRQQKIALTVGPKRSGKGTIARIHTALLGRANVAAPTLASLSGNFGLQCLLGKRLAIVSDARLSGRADQAVIAERLLSISGEDNITIDRKHREAVTARLTSRFMIMTNELPRLADASGALASRFVVLVLHKSFYGREDHGLTDSLLQELPGILQWAVDGWHSLRDRGYFRQPDTSAEAIRELEDLGSPIAAFLRDRCDVGPGQRIEVDRLWESWKSWCETQGRDRPGTRQSFGRDLRAAVPGLSITQPRTAEGGRTRYYEGVGIGPCE